MAFGVVRSRWFWIFLVICVVEELTFFFPFLSLFLLAAAFSPRIALRFAEIFVEYYNQVNDTNFRIHVQNDAGESVESNSELDGC